MSAPVIHCFDDNSAMTAALVAHAVPLFDVAKPGSLLLSGGSTPGDFYTALGQADLAWSDICVALVDERWVDEDDAGSNAALLKRTLMAGRGANAAFTPMKTAHETPHAAAAHIHAAYAALPAPALMILGMGPDAHTASWFTEAPEYDAISKPGHGALVAGVAVPPGPVRGAYGLRMSITANYLAAVQNAFLIIKGRDKLALLQDALATPDATPIGRAAALLGSHLQIFALLEA